MGLTQAVQKQVARALRKIGNLGTNVTIRKKALTEYDLASSSVIEGTTAPELIVPGFQEKVTRDVGTDAYSIRTSVILDSQVLDGPLDNYDQVILRGFEWNLVDVMDDGFLTTLELRRRL
jgi:hypothetical protein